MIGTAVYVYGVTRGRVTDPPPGIGERPVEAVEHGDLTALASEVPLSEFGAAALRENLEDLDWLEPVARGHHEVIAAASVAGEIVPFRLFTLFADRARAAQMLADEHDRLDATLTRLRGCAEWSVKLLAEPTAGPAAAPTAAEDPAAVAAGRAGGTPAEDAPGHAFFARKRAQAATRRQASASLEAAVGELLIELRSASRAVVRLPAQPRALTHHRGEMVLNAACLVEGTRTDAFRETADATVRRHRDTGLRLELTGPFAPYNFTAEPVDAVDRDA